MGFHIVQNKFREKAEMAKFLKQVQVKGSLQEFGYILLEMFWTALAGAIAGLIAGYISHLILDAQTPLSICKI